MSAVTDRLRLTDYMGVTPLGMCVTAVSVIAALLAVVFFSVLYGGRAAGKTICRHWSEQTGIPTKFEILYWADTGTCLARTPDGRWVLNTKVQVYIPGGKR